MCYLSSALRSLTSSEKYGSSSKQLTRLITSQRWEPFESRLFLSLFCCCWFDLFMSNINLLDWNSWRRPAFSHTADTTSSILFKAETKQSAHSTDCCSRLPSTCWTAAQRWMKKACMKPLWGSSQKRPREEDPWLSSVYSNYTSWCT